MNIELNWLVIPAASLIALRREFKEINYYDPYFGRGLYTFSVAAKNPKYAIYYIGKAENTVNRLMQHIEEEYMTVRPGIYLPDNVDDFLTEPYSVFHDNKLSLERSEAEITERARTSETMMMNTYFGFATVPIDYEEMELTEIEAALQFGLIEKWPELKGKGWIGESRMTIPDRTFTVFNRFDNDRVQRIIGTTLPEKIEVDHGKVLID